MHKLEKRQAIEAAEKSGNADADPVSTNIWILYIIIMQFAILGAYIQHGCSITFNLILGSTNSSVLPTRLFEPRWKRWK